MKEESGQEKRSSNQHKTKNLMYLKSQNCLKKNLTDLQQRINFKSLTPKGGNFLSYSSLNTFDHPIDQFLKKDKKDKVND